MVKAVDFINDYGPEYYAGEEYWESAYPRENVIKIVNDFARQIVEFTLKQAGEKDFFAYLISQEDILSLQEEIIKQLEL